MPPARVRGAAAGADLLSDANLASLQAEFADGEAGGEDDADEEGEEGEEGEGEEDDVDNEGLALEA